MRPAEEKVIPGMMTVQEAALAAGLHEVTVRGAMNRGRLPFVRAYGRLLIEQEAFEQWRRSIKVGRPKKKEAASGTL